MMIGVTVDVKIRRESPLRKHRPASGPTNDRDIRLICNLTTAAGAYITPATAEKHRFLFGSSRDRSIYVYLVTLSIR